jgi:hypothetical protein
MNSNSDQQAQAEAAKRRVLWALVGFWLMMAVADGLIKPGGIWNLLINLATAVGSAVLTFIWCRYDSSQRGFRLGAGIRILIILIGPLALMFYLASSRSPRAALKAIGLTIVFFVALLVMSFLVATGIAMLRNPLTATTAQAVAPRTKFPRRGIILVSPDEDGWRLSNDTGTVISLSKYGPTKIETYLIEVRVNDIEHGLKCEKLLAGSVNGFSGGEVGDRFKIRMSQAELDPSRGPNFGNYYLLSEDYAARGMPANQRYALLEEMGFMACHPNDPRLFVRVGYSYRYYPGHEDPEFKKKAKWVLDQMLFTVDGR